MKTHEKNPFLNPPNSILAIVRSLEEGPNYQPNWRWLKVQQHLAEINNSAEAAGEFSTRLELILDREKDEIIRKTLQFHCGVLSDDSAAVEYALRTASTPLAVEQIKAMVVANGPIERIAKEMGTHPAKIDFFEKLYFDVRPYVDNRGWLRTICIGSSAHRYLKVALDRGWAGVEEVVLQRTPKGPRDLSPRSAFCWAGPKLISWSGKRPIRPKVKKICSCFCVSYRPTPMANFLFWRMQWRSKQSLTTNLSKGS
jgi:hypothetical protein